jgi:hypothetical protein
MRRCRPSLRLESAAHASDGATGPPVARPTLNLSYKYHYDKFWQVFVKFIFRIGSTRGPLKSLRADRVVEVNRVRQSAARGSTPQTIELGR